MRVPFLSGSHPLPLSLVVEDPLALWSQAQQVAVVRWKTAVSSVPAPLRQLMKAVLMSATARPEYAWGESALEGQSILAGN